MVVNMYATSTINKNVVRFVYISAVKSLVYEMWYTNKVLIEVFVEQQFSSTNLHGQP